MESDKIRTELTNIFKKVFNNPQIVLKDELTANDIEKWDSLTHMILISEIESLFQIKFKLKDLNKMNNVGKMIEIVSQKIV
jgi:acyl carrier protein